MRISRALLIATLVAGISACASQPRPHVPTDDDGDDNFRPAVVQPNDKVADALANGGVVIDSDPRRTVIRNPDGSTTVIHPTNY